MHAPYFLAVDVGTSRTAAATARTAPDGSLVAAPFPLGRQTDNAPTAVYVGDTELLFGDAAERRGAAQPSKLVREFKRRIGDDVPIVASDRHFSPEELYAHAVDEVVRAVIEREGRHPEGIAITVPATWGTYRTNLVAASLARFGWDAVDLIAEPEAAARHYESTRPLEPGRALAVYDLGGGTFDAVVLRKDADGRVRIVGRPTGIADLGGADFDDLVIRHAVRTAGISARGVPSDRERVALASLRRECVEAKESLSFDSEAVIPVLVGDGLATVRLTRSEFEDMIDDQVERTISVFEDALASAGVEAEELDAILLTGGSSRIPRIAQLLSERFDRPIAIDADPKAIIALGAARAVADSKTAQTAAAALAPADDADASAAAVSSDDLAAPVAAKARRPWYRRLPTTAGLAACGLVLAGGIVVSSGWALGASAPEVPAASGFDPTLALLADIPDADETAVRAAAVSPERVVAETPAPRFVNPRTPNPQPSPRATPGSRTTPTPDRAATSTKPSTGPTGAKPNTQTPVAPGPAEPAPTTPPTTQTPSDPPTTPSAPPPTTPTPSDPPPDPTPSDPPPDPVPSDPPPDPAPTEQAPPESTPVEPAAQV